MKDEHGDEEDEEDEGTQSPVVSLKLRVEMT